MYCGWKGCRRQNRNAIKNCIVTGGMGAGQALGAGAGRVGRWASGRRALARGRGRRAGGRRAWAKRRRQRRWGAQQVLGRVAGFERAAGARGRHSRSRRWRTGRAGRAGRVGRAGLGVLAGQLRQVGALCTWLSFESVFDPV